MSELKINIFYEYRLELQGSYVDAFLLPSNMSQGCPVSYYRFYMSEEVKRNKQFASNII